MEVVTNDENAVEKPKADKRLVDDGGGDIIASDSKLSATNNKNDVSNMDDASTAAAPWQPIPVYLETTIRMTIASFVAYCLAYADIPNAIPPSTQYLVGLFGPVIAMRIPTFAFASGAMIPVIMVCLFFGLACSTALLAAATKSDGAMVGVFACLTFWVGGLHYGRAGKVMWIFAPVIIVALALVTTSAYQIVQDGIHVTVPLAVLASLSSGGGDEGGGLVSSFADVLKAAVAAIQYILANPEKNGMDIPIQEGNFAGRTVHIELTNNFQTVDVSMEGGMWIVKRFWTWSGLNNSLAVMQNYTIAFCWALLCSFISPMFFPLRTSRRRTARQLLPPTLRDAAVAIKNAVTSSLEDTLMKGETADEDANQQQERLDRLIKNANSLTGGTVAMTSAFEPRLLDMRPWRLHHIECTWMKLKDVAVATEQAALLALVLDMLPCLPSESIELYTKTAIVLEECAGVLEAGHGVVAIPGEDMVGEEKPRDGDSAQDDAEAADDPTDTFSLQVLSSDVAMAINSYHSAMSGDQDSTCKDYSRNFAHNVVPFFVPSFHFFHRLMEIVILPFKRSTWTNRFNIGKLAHYIKYAIGATAILSMMVYWDSYKEYEVIDKSTESFITIEGTPPSNFGGWNLIAYAFATMPTVEGTIKKCILRFGGMLIGAFLAWICLHWSDNEYGLVAWLTATNFLAVLFSVERDDVSSARAGQSKDYGYWGFYVVLTQVVIVMEHRQGTADRNELVVDRIVSNCVGIGMAALMAVIPPTVRGGDPERASHIIAEGRIMLADAFRLVLDGKVGELEKLRKDRLVKIGSLRSEASALLEDASRLSKFPFYRIDPQLDKELKSMIITFSFLDLTLKIPGQFTDKNTLGKHTELGTKLTEVLQELEGGKMKIEDKIEEAEASNQGHLSFDDSANLFLQFADIVMTRLDMHDKALFAIEWGFWSGVNNKKYLHNLYGT